MPRLAPAAVIVELVAHLACELHVRGLELGFAATGAAASAGGLQPVAGAFGEQVALELADSAEHREEHAPGSG